MTRLLLANSRMPGSDSLRPKPELLTLPNGKSGEEITLPLMDTVFASRLQGEELLWG